MFFGKAPDGSDVELVTLEAGGLKAAILSWGATVQDLRLAGHDHPLVLGFPEIRNYLENGGYLGATVGRFANRIANGCFSIDGQSFQLDRNFLGKHSLHGGSLGFDKRNWRIEERSTSSLVLWLVDPDGHMGFPGNCEIISKFTIVEENVLQIEYEAVTDRPTICNIAHHGYFNLNGGGNVLNHELQIEAEHYLPVNEELIPTGEIRKVAGTALDFRKARTIRSAGGGENFAHDHNYCLRNEKDGSLRKSASVKSRQSGICMEMYTTEPGLQLYTASKLKISTPGLDGKKLESYGGICLEAQNWPDAPNHSHFPDSVLVPGERYYQKTQYRFSNC